MRKFFSFIFIFSIMILFLVLFSYSEMISSDLYDYYVVNSLQDTGATNAVAAILLNYRLFDTFFEALMLLISVLGIIYFSRFKGGYSRND